MSDMNAWLSSLGNKGMNGGSNQHMSYPNINPSQGPYGFSYAGENNPHYLVGGTNKLPGGSQTTPTLDPGFTRQFMEFLSGQAGRGVQGYDGQLTADVNPMIQQLMQFFSGGGGSGMPGADQLGEMAKTGMPIDQTDAWQKMVAAQQGNIHRNEADLREQFAFSGNLQSSPFGGAMSGFESQTTADQNAMLAQMVAQAQESARGRQLQAGEFLNSGQMDMGKFLQEYGQGADDRMYQEFQRTQSQNNPLMQIMAQFAQMQPGVYQRKGAADTFSQIMQGIGSIFNGSVTHAV